jgi:Zn-dependent membrane protease YugP
VFSDIVAAEEMLVPSLPSRKPRNRRLRLSTATYKSREVFSRSATSHRGGYASDNRAGSEVEGRVREQ